ncbi:efflux RND transporter permease subunit, partial [Candidatus Latescibacterota bacterium]
MKKLVSLFVRYPFYANLIIAVFLIAGLSSFLNMKKAYFPERESRRLSISVSYPGASPKEMEEGLTTRIEEAVRGIVGIKEINSTSSENRTSIQIETTGEYDIDETVQEVKNAVDSISAFPAGAEKPVIYKRRSRASAMRLSLSGDVDLLTLKQYADEVENDFLSSGIITQVSISGYPALEISVESTEQDLLRYNLTFDEISRSISMNNRDFSAGMIKSDEEEIMIRSRARSVDPDDIGNIILRANDDGSFLRVRDVADVKMKFADVPSKTLINGKQSVNITVEKLPEEDLEQIANFVNEYAEEFNSKTQGVTLHTTYDFLERLSSRLNMLYRNGGVGLLLVVISLGVFLNLRLAFWVAFGIPASFLAMFIAAEWYGITINVISLNGMIMVVGILVDDGIVIGENIFSHYEAGKSPKRAAIDGTMEVLYAVVTSVTTTIVAFSPLLFITGRMEFMFEMAFVVVFSLLFSLFEAFFVLPAHIGSPHVLRSNASLKNPSKIRAFLNRAINFMRYQMYGSLLRRVIYWKWAVLATPISIALVSIGLFQGGIIKSTFFPSIPYDSFNVNIAFVPGSGEKRTFEYLQRFDEIIWSVNEQLMIEYDDPIPFVEYTVVNLGSGFDGQERGAHTGYVSVLLKDLEGSPVSSFMISEKVRNKIGKVPESEKFTVGGRNRWGSPISISLLGKNLEELDLAKDMLTKELQDIPQIYNITDSNAIGKREVRLKLKPEAYFLGLDHAGISNQVRQGFYGGQSQRLQYGKDEVRIWVRYPKQDRVNLGQLENMKVKTPQGQYPLSEIASYSIERGPVNINHFNNSKEARIDADMVDPYAPVPPILEVIETTIMPDLHSRYPGVRVVYQGQAKDNDEATGEMKKYFTMAFLLIIVILMIHFKSVTQPLIIIAMVPMAVLGAAWGHGIEGKPLSLLSLWGIVALCGVIVNDAVVFLSKYNTNLVEGQMVPDAIYNAGVSRFRPILLTTITTVCGLYPIVLEGSRQSEFLKPMAISLAYGVGFGTMFILLFLPVYVMVM